MKTTKLLTGLLLSVLFTLSVWASEPDNAQQVENFMLLDHLGKAQELFYYRDAAAIVIMVQGNGCPIVRNALPDIKSVREQYQDKNIRFFMINSNLQDDRAAIVKEAEEYGIDFPILYDDAQLIGESLGLDRTAEVLLIDPESWRIIYRGPINDRLDYERQSAEAGTHYLADAIDLHLSGEPQIQTQRKTKGCLINFPERDQRSTHKDISYSEDVAPILLERCAGCHREGGIGPWAMNRYLMVKGFAPMMREVIRTARMPPKHLDTERSQVIVPHDITVEERKTLIHWIEAGAPRGEGDDPLLAVSEQVMEWELGEPDLILDVQPFSVPATGLIEYKYFYRKIPIAEKKYVRAVQFVPGDRATVHHSVNRLVSENMSPVEAALGPAPAPSRLFSLIYEEGWHAEAARLPAPSHLITFAPGAEVLVFDDNVGMRLEPGLMVESQMHYTTTGKEAEDSSKIGLWFYSEEPEFEMLHHVLNGPLTVPPMAKNYQAKIYFKFLGPAVLYRLFPHAHYRATSSEFRLLYPDGSEEMLLSVPAYDFNWQFEYELEQPLEVPKGTRLLHMTTYDNSPEKRGNPNPAVEVHSGAQSEDEMLFGGISFRYVNKEDHQRYNLKQFHVLSNLVGAYDENLSGGLDSNEFANVPNNNKLLKYAAFFLLDDDGDGEISVDEWFNHRWFKHLRTGTCASLCV
jgi:hypothetical protein